jgi:uncharacterized protein with von Willebrand factor type A (vWA) domain
VEPDLALLAVAFGDALHRAGVPVTPERAGRLAQAVALVRPATTTELYWVARVTCLTGHTQLDAFDRVFAQVFGGLADPADWRGDGSAPPPASVRSGPPPATDRSPGASAGGTDPGASTPTAGEAVEGADGQEVAVGMASATERLATTDFAALGPDELFALRRLMADLRVDPPQRSSRRARRHPHGDRLDVRATLARSRRTGGDPAVPVRRRTRTRPRRVVVLCDISASMAPYARAYVQFLHATAGALHAEVFTFATRLTRLTRALSVSEPQAALERAARAAPDWEGGTRIGSAVAEFLDRYGRRGMARGAVVVIVSDGWEQDDATLLGEQMARLHRLAHRIVWVNPRAADPRYQPLAGGMAAALPYCDAVVSGHNLAALQQVVEVMASPPASRGPAPERPPGPRGT